MNEQPAMATNPAHVRTKLVAVYTGVSEYPDYVPFDERINRALADLDRGGCELVDIRFQIEVDGDGDKSMFALIIGRKR